MAGKVLPLSDKALKISLRAEVSGTEVASEEERAMLKKIRQLSLESRRELDDLLEDLLDYEEDKRDARAMRRLAVRALAQDDNAETDI